jgi:hypothetical protein
MNYDPNPFADPIKQLESKLALQQDALDHRLSKLNMKKAWQESMADNVDATHPLLMGVYIEPSCKLIERASLRIRLEKFRSYGTGAAAGGGVTATSQTSSLWELVPGIYVPEATSNSGSHDHSGLTGETEGHAHTISDAGGHVHAFVADHQHDVELADHSHDITHGIYEGTQASDVTVEINGTNRTAALGGPFNTNQNSLDIRQYLTPTGWNTIELGSATLGRIWAVLYLQVYLP